MSKDYPSNLSRAQYEFLCDLTPEAIGGGTSPRSGFVGSPIAPFSVVLVEGVQWRANLCDFPAWQTVYTYFRNWRFDGTWVKIHDHLREFIRIEQQRHPSPTDTRSSMSLSVKSAAMVHEAVGYDAGKQYYWTQAIYDGRYSGVDAAGVGHTRVCQSARGALQVL